MSEQFLQFVKECVSATNALPARSLLDFYHNKLREISTKTSARKVCLTRFSLLLPLPVLDHFFGQRTKKHMENGYHLLC